jgi:hypothetical protein
MEEGGPDQSRRRVLTLELVFNDRHEEENRLRAVCPAVARWSLVVEI